MRALALLPVLLLPACATIVNGSTQTVSLTSTPVGSSCTVDRTGARLATVPSTPGSMILQRSSNELVVTCNKDGYQTASKTVPASFSGATFGNIILGGIVGVVVDASSGANHYYPDSINVEMAADVTKLPPASNVPTATGDQPYEPGQVIRLKPMVQPVSATGVTPSAVSPKL